MLPLASGQSATGDVSLKAALCKCNSASKEYFVTNRGGKEKGGVTWRKNKMGSLKCRERYDVKQK